MRAAASAHASLARSAKALTTGRGGKLIAIDAANNTILASVAVGARPWGVAVSPDGRYVFTANGPSNDVTVVSADRLAVIRKIQVGDRPWGVAVAPTGGRP